MCRGAIEVREILGRGETGVDPGPSLDVVGHGQVGGAEPDFKSHRIGTILKLDSGRRRSKTGHTDMPGAPAELVD